MITVYRNILKRLHKDYDAVYKLNQFPKWKGAYDRELERLDKRIIHYNKLLEQEEEKIWIDEK